MKVLWNIPRNFKEPLAMSRDPFVYVHSIDEQTEVLKTNYQNCLIQSEARNQHCTCDLIISWVLQNSCNPFSLGSQPSSLRPRCRMCRRARPCFVETNFVVVLQF